MVQVFNSQRINLHNTYEIKSWLYYFENGFTLRNPLFGGVNLTKNADPDKYSYSGYRISFDEYGSSSLPNWSFGTDLVIFGADMSSSLHMIVIKDILMLGKGPTQGLDDTTLTTEVVFAISFIQQWKEFYFLFKSTWQWKQQLFIF